MIPVKAQEILDFWFKETPSEKRFKKDDVFDETKIFPALIASLLSHVLI